MNKQEYILELIQKGHSDEEIELLVKDKFPEEEIILFMPAAPAASTNVTPQAYLDRLVAVTKKIEAKKLNKSGIAFYKGEIKEFAEEKTGTKFEDNTFFDKYVLELGATLIGGFGGHYSTGSVISHTHTQGVHSHRLVDTENGMVYKNVTKDSRPNRLEDAHNYLGGSISVPMSNDQGKNDWMEPVQPTINATGGDKNLPYGLQIIKVVYVAKKDITFADMGE